MAPHVQLRHTCQCSSPAGHGECRIDSSNGFGSIYALSRATGKIIWTYASGGAAGGVASGLSAANGVLYAQCRNSVGGCAFDAQTGAVLGTYGQAGYTMAPPVVANGAVLQVCGANSVCLYAP